MLCKLCKKDINETRLDDLFGVESNNLCYHCFLTLFPKRNKFRIGKYCIETLYLYKGAMKEALYLYKGCYDYELRNIFLDFYKNEIGIKYYNYWIAFAPSNIDADKKRGFNHVEAIFENLPNQKIKCFFKKEEWKQSEKSKNERQQIKNIIGINTGQIGKVKKMLIVDDIVTSGSTLLACANLAKKHGIKQIKLLAICHNVEK